VTITNLASKVSSIRLAKKQEKKIPSVFQPFPEPKTYSSTGNKKVIS